MQLYHIRIKPDHQDKLSEINTVILYRIHHLISLCNLAKRDIPIRIIQELNDRAISFLNSVQANILETSEDLNEFDYSTLMQQIKHVFDLTEKLQLEIDNFENEKSASQFGIICYSALLTFGIEKLDTANEFSKYGLSLKTLDIN